VSAAEQVPPARPVRPRNAASLVLVDRGGAEPKVLMGRRHSRMAFVPDAFVFPGGKLDPEDRRATPASPLKDEVLNALAACNHSAAMAEALALAAIRETQEETGLFIAAPGEIPEAAGTPWAPFRERRLAPHLGALSLLARAITPTESPIRFHVRFFVADATETEGTLASSGELEELDWYPLSDARKLPMIDVTEFMLAEIAAGGPRKADRPPLYSYRNGKPFVRR